MVDVGAFLSFSVFVVSRKKKNESTTLVIIECCITELHGSAMQMPSAAPTCSLAIRIILTKSQVTGARQAGNMVHVLIVEKARTAYVALQ